VLGLDPLRDRSEITERLGAQLQESRLQDKIRVGEVLDLYASFYRNPADWRELVDRLGLEGKVRSKYSDLSGGQKQRLSIALALVGSPEIAILDELTTGLDPQARRSTWDTIEQIRTAGVTVVLVTHFMDEAERLCDRIMVIDRGRLVAIDSPSGLIRRSGSDQTLRFRPSVPIDDEVLTGLSEVVTVHREGSQIVITGTGNVVQAVSSLLARRGVIAEDLRVDQTSLEDAYLELTNRSDVSAKSASEER
jgi:ABC-2 type transport system ATP-binding protein